MECLAKFGPAELQISKDYQNDAFLNQFHLSKPTHSHQKMLWKHQSTQCLKKIIFSLIQNNHGPESIMFQEAEPHYPF